MGFEVAQTAMLEFEEGHRLHGSHVRVSLDMALREYAALHRAAREFQAKGEDDLGADDLDRLAEVVERWADEALIDWDLELKGAALEASAAGMRQLPVGVQMALFQAWSTTVAAVPPNSDAVSESGAPSAEPLAGTAAS